MDATRSLWLLVPRPLRELPADLAAMAVIVVFTNVTVFVPVIRDTPLRVPVGLVFVLFVPGYSFIAALFPEQGESPEPPAEEDSERSGRAGIDRIERVALSFGLSIAIVPLIGLVLNFTPWGIRLAPIMVSVSGCTLGTIAIGAYRRQQLPAAQRLRVPYQQWLSTGRESLLEPETRTDGLLNIVLVVSILLATGSVAYAVVIPPQVEQFSELYILTENDDGELVADGYPTEFVRGEGQEVVLGIENNEHQRTNYSVVVVEQAVETVGNESIVREQRELQRFETQLSHNETWQRPHDIAPTIVGNGTRVEWLLYVDRPIPPNPSRENADYSVHLWINVIQN
jgi:uncharacterized membrane protein